MKRTCEPQATATPSNSKLLGQIQPIHLLSLGAGVQSSTLALMAAYGEVTPMPTAGIFADTKAEPASVYRWLDWLEKNGVNGLTFNNAACSGPITRAMIDKARHAPQPKVTVISGKGKDAE